MNSKMNRRSSRPRSPLFICFVGTDGAGKTTLARAFVRRQNRDHQVAFKYFEGGTYYTYLMPLLRKLGKRGKFKEENEFKDYANYLKAKKQTLNASKWRQKAYARLLLVDYSLLVFFKVVLPRLRGYQIASARYIYDVALKLKLLLNLNESRTHRIVQQFFSVLPKPDYVFLIDVPEEVAFQRKNDVPSLKYLADRRELYHHFMQPYVTAVLDGCRPVEELLAEVDSYIFANDRGLD